MDLHTCTIDTASQEIDIIILQLLSTLCEYYQNKFTNIDIVIIIIITIIIIVVIIATLPQEASENSKYIFFLLNQL